MTDNVRFFLKIFTPLITITFFSTFAQSTESIDIGNPLVDLVKAEMLYKVTEYYGEGTSISFQSFFGGMSKIIMKGENDGNTHTYIASEITSKKGNILWIDCNIINISQKPQSFCIGDMSLLLDYNKIDFNAVGTGDFVVTTDKFDHDIVKKKEIEIGGGKSISIKYVYLLDNNNTYVYLLNHNNIVYKLLYKNQSIEFKPQRQK